MSEHSSTMMTRRSPASNRFGILPSELRLLTCSFVPLTDVDRIARATLADSTAEQWMWDSWDTLRDSLKHDHTFLLETEFLPDTDMSPEGNVDPRRASRRMPEIGTIETATILLPKRSEAHELTLLRNVQPHVVKLADLISIQGPLKMLYFGYGGSLPGTDYIPREILSYLPADIVVTSQPLSRDTDLFDIRVPPLPGGTKQVIHMVDFTEGDPILAFGLGDANAPNIAYVFRSTVGFAESGCSDSIATVLRDDSLTDQNVTLVLDGVVGSYDGKSADRARSDIRKSLQSFGYFMEGAIDEDMAKLKVIILGGNNETADDEERQMYSDALAMHTAAVPHLRR